MKASNAGKHGIESTKAVRLPLSSRLYQRVERAARENGCAVTELIVSTLETQLPALPENLPPEISADLGRWSLLDDEALLAIASAFLPLKQHRRYSTLLRKAKAGRLTLREQAEWDTLQQEYLRFSQNKAKAQFLLAQRKKATRLDRTTA